MNRLQHLRHTLTFNNWANAMAANALKALDDAPPRAVRICAHIVGAEQLWLSRLQRKGPPEVWPDLNASQCAEHAMQLAEAWGAWSMTLDATCLEDAVEYVNSKGDPWSNTVADIITHVTHHAAYHRGQIAVLLGAAGHEPPYVDYIHAKRQGLI